MIVKCACQHCSQNIEFEAEHDGAFVECPNCAKQTRLIIPGGHRLEFSAPPVAKKFSIRKDWPKAVAAFVICAMVIAIVCVLHHDGFKWPDMIGSAFGMGVGITAVALIVSLVWYITREKMWLRLFSIVMVLMGGYLFIDGFDIWQSVNNSKDGTVMQQQYSMEELATGGVFIGLGFLVYLGHAAVRILNQKSP